MLKAFLLILRPKLNCFIGRFLLSVSFALVENNIGCKFCVLLILHPLSHSQLKCNVHVQSCKCTTCRTFTVGVHAQHVFQILVHSEFVIYVIKLCRFLPASL